MFNLHKPVLLEEVMSFLAPEPGNIIVDATIGGAGHAEAIMQKIYPGGMLIGIDQDSESLKIANERLKSSKTNFKLINRNFRDIKDIIKESGIDAVDGILFDLGISSMQLDEPERGFSIKNPGPLDMRMDRNSEVTAKRLINTLSEKELAYIIKEFGDERFYRRIARRIVAAREKKEIADTGELADIIAKSMPYGRRREKIHPATRTFQALRIKVNDELGALRDVLENIPEVLRPAGRVCVISFHSLEDRIAKNVLKGFSAQGIFELLTRKPLQASEEEVLANPRARSAKLRAAVKVDAGAMGEKI